MRYYSSLLQINQTNLKIKKSKINLNQSANQAKINFEIQSSSFDNNKTVVAKERYLIGHTALRRSASLIPSSI